MSNETTENAILNNTISILTGLGLSVHSLVPDPKVITTHLAVVDLKNISFGQNHGNDPEYNLVDVIILIFLNDPSKSAAQAKQTGWIHSLNSAISVDSLNVGDLLATKLVADANHNVRDTDYNKPIADIEYSVEVNYRST